MKRKQTLCVTAAAMSVILAGSATAVWAGEVVDYSGSPWNNASVYGALAEEQPALEDDFYAFVNYEWLQEHNSDYAYDIPVTINSTLTGYLMGLLTEEDPSDEVQQQVQIMYNQANDLETLAEQSISPIRPYLEQVEQTETIEELNAVLSDESFLLDVFFTTRLSNNGMDGVNVYGIFPYFAFAEDMDGARLYRSVNDTSDGEEVEQNATVKNELDDAMKKLSAIGYEDAGTAAVYALYFEMSYGKYAPYNSLPNDLDWGTIGEEYSYYSLDELQELFGAFPIKAILSARGQDICETYFIECPEWAEALAELYTQDNLESIKTCIELMICKEASAYLDPYLFNSAAVVADNGYAVVTGADNSVSGKSTFGMYLADRYVSEGLGQDIVDRLTTITKNVLDAFKRTIQNCEWMDESTREGALEKLNQMHLNILVPEGGYFDFSGITLDGETLFDNYLITKKYNMDAMNEKMGQSALSVASWYCLSPLMANAFYEAESNSINILPGYIGENTFTLDMTEEEAYATVGTVVGHELGHSLDYSGSQYGVNGQPENWFSEESLQVFLEKIQKLVDYYDSILIINGIYCDGELVKTEATADLTAVNTVLEYARGVEDWNYDEFFRTHAELWRTSTGYVYAMYLLQVDSHPLFYLRANVNLQMFEEFYETYNIEEGDGMYLAEEERLSIW